MKLEKINEVTVQISGDITDLLNMALSAKQQAETMHVKFENLGEEPLRLYYQEKITEYSSMVEDLEAMTEITSLED